MSLKSLTSHYDFEKFPEIVSLRRNHILLNTVNPLPDSIPVDLQFNL